MNASEMAFPVATPDYCYSTPYSSTNASADKEEDEVIVIPERFRHVFYGYEESEFAGMAPPIRANNPEEQGLLTTDCGATSTLTNSFHNMTSVVPKVVTIQLAAEGATMKTSHMGYKTYYVFDRTGTIRPISTKAYFVKELKQDLLGGSALTSERYRVILDKDDDIAGIYPVADNGTIDPANSFPFVSEYSGGLFYLRTAPIDATKCSSMSGYDL
jgi:hypothetical protein